MGPSSLASAWGPLEIIPSHWCLVLLRTCVRSFRGFALTVAVRSLELTRRLLVEAYNRLFEPYVKPDMDKRRHYGELPRSHGLIYLLIE